MNAFFDSDVLAMKGPVGIPHIPPHLEHPEAITQYGQTWLWVGFGAMCVGVLAFTGTTLRAPYRYRLLHITTMLVSVIAAISYFAMASGVGSVLVHSTGRSTTREVFYARYIDWAFTTPLLLLDVTLLAGLPVGEIGLVVIADIIMVVTGGIAALHPSLKYRWGFYTFSCLAFAWVLYTLVTSGRSYAHLRSPKVGQLYNGVSLALVAVWTAYPIVFFFSEGTGRLSADNEVLAYAILDIIAKPIWGLALLLAIPEEGHVAIPSWAASAGGSVSGGGYGAVPSANDA